MQPTCILWYVFYFNFTIYLKFSTCLAADCTDLDHEFCIYIIWDFGDIILITACVI